MTEDGYAVDSGVTRRVQRPLRDERSDSTTLTGRVYGQRGEQLDLQVGMTGSATPGEQHVPNHHPVVISDHRHERVSFGRGKQLGDQPWLDG